MVKARAIGRIGILAAGLGIGAAIASTSGIASAETAVDPFAFDLNDIAISFDGVTLFQQGTASAASGMGDLAIAIGDGSEANAGAGDAFGQTLAPGQFDVAVAEGTGSFASAGQGNFDSAFAEGASSVAAVGGFQSILSNGDWASAIGPHADAEAGVFALAGQNDGALVFDPFGTLGSTAEAGDGNFDLASTFGDHDSALAGFPGSFDLGAVFGDGLSSTGAQGGNYLVDILPAIDGLDSALSTFLTDLAALF